MTTEHVGIVDSQRLYDFVLSRKDKLPLEGYKMEGTIYTLYKDGLEEIYDIVARNRANSKATVLDLTLDDDYDVIKIKGEAKSIPPQEIPKPRPAPKKLKKTT